MLATDPYGNFIPGPHGLPQYVTDDRPGRGQPRQARSPVPAERACTSTRRSSPTSPTTPTRQRRTPTTTRAPPPAAPTPDADTTPSADFASQPAGTYDDEMLERALHLRRRPVQREHRAARRSTRSSTHEHDRLVDDIKNTLTTDTLAQRGVAALAEWKPTTAGAADGWNGERLFQAARFVTEMEYQHLVFEEFARKVQPAIRPFHVYYHRHQPGDPGRVRARRLPVRSLDARRRRSPAPTTDPDGAKTDNSLPLLDGVPQPAGVLQRRRRRRHATRPSRRPAAIVMGSSDQVGNELDEFITETLRNNLLGLPLDLPTLNLTRARERGHPAAERRAPAALRADQRRPAGARTRAGPTSASTSSTPSR